tara:strand:+ start:121 stop:630 length:510 start_codon:yes stop_codon:yes gene_type:complete
MEDLIIEQHPDYENLNQKLLKESEGVIYDWTDITYVRGKMSEWHICGKYIDVIKEWAKTLTPSVKGMIPRIIDAWYARYDYGNHALVHNHGDIYASFVYYIKTPEGSSPIIFPDENETVEAKEGNLLIFPGHINHYVPENKCDGRVVIAGNINLFNVISTINSQKEIWQ